MFKIVLHCSTCPVLSSCNCFPRYRGSSEYAKKIKTETLNLQPIPGGLPPLADSVNHDLEAVLVA